MLLPCSNNEWMHTRRHGGMSVWVVLAMGVLLALLALAVDGAYLWMAKVEMRNAADAIALATAQALLRDEVLTNRPEAMWQTTQEAYKEAVRYGQVNPVLGRPLELVFDPGDSESSDVVFGYRENAEDRNFQAAVDLGDVNINAVRVIARRTRQRGNPAGMFFGRLLGLPVADVVASATAYLDRDVIGFRPVGQRPIPLAPLALLSDPNLSKPMAWETQTLAPIYDGPPDAADRFRFDPVRRRFLEVDAEADPTAHAYGSVPGDGIYEMDVRFPVGESLAKTDSADEETNACLVLLRPTDEASGPPGVTVARHFRQGVTSHDLKEMGGQLVLGEDNRLVLAGMPSITDEAVDSLYQALEALRDSAEPRIWPLYSAILQDQESATGWRVTIQGFVAARVVRVVLSDGMGSDVPSLSGEHGVSARRELRLVLQPCQLAVNAAVTDSARRYANPGVSIHNRYIAKVRLVNE